eukprot:6211050-Pleurochrysis_carterae.AAC.7
MHHVCVRKERFVCLLAWLHESSDTRGGPQTGCIACMPASASLCLAQSTAARAEQETATE